MQVLFGRVLAWLGRTYKRGSKYALVNLGEKGTKKRDAVSADNLRIS